MIGTDADVDRRLRRCRRDRRAVLPRHADRRAEPSRRWSRRWPRAATTSSTLLARPAGVGPGCWRGCSSSRWSAATTPSWPPTRACAPGLTHFETIANIALGGLLRRLRSGPLAEPGERRATARARDRRAADRALGPRRRPRALRPCPAHARATPRRHDQRPLRGLLDPGEGSRAARRRVQAARRLQPARAPRAGRRRPRGGGAPRPAE